MGGPLAEPEPEAGDGDVRAPQHRAWAGRVPPQCGTGNSQAIVHVVRTWYKRGVIPRTAPWRTLPEAGEALAHVTPALGCPVTPVCRFPEAASDVPAAPPAAVAEPRGLVPVGGPFRAPQPLRTEGGPPSCVRSTTPSFRGRYTGTVFLPRPEFQSLQTPDDQGERIPEEKAVF